MPGPEVGAAPFNGQSPLTPRAGHCGFERGAVERSETGSEQCLPPRANNRTSGPALLAGGARRAPPSARPLPRGSPARLPGGVKTPPYKAPVSGSS